MPHNPYPYQGLNDEQVAASARKFGKNVITKRPGKAIWLAIKEVVFEPMFLLLLACAVIYFVLGEKSEGYFMTGAIILVSAISIFQNARSNKALKALKAYTRSQAKVIRNNTLVDIPSEEIVIGDVVVASEGEIIPADGVVLQTNDLSINEAILTGEAFAVTKDTQDPLLNTVAQGTVVISGQCVFTVTQIGKQTRIGKIGTAVGEIDAQKTPLQVQIQSFVGWMALAGGAIFLLIWGIHYFRTGDVLDSLLKGLTIAMSVLPEEIPVAFATFMALGAYRLMKMGIIVKHTQTVETLGSATVICTDKTGTITENRMELFKVYHYSSDSMMSKEAWGTPEAFAVLEAAMWSSETVPFDPMEKALHNIYAAYTPEDLRPKYTMVHEYPISGKPPMMTHIFELMGKGSRIIACKGAPEAVIAHSTLSAAEQEKIREIVTGLSREGLRILGVGLAEKHTGAYPETQQEFAFTFVGLVCFYDPPKPNIADTFRQLYDAGIQLKIISGDNAQTTAAIAKQANFYSPEPPVNADDLLKLSEQAFADMVMKANIFTRMFPEVKLKIINSLKAQHQIVGMTGDGVNDGPALKAAHIGIAMGKRGSEIARQASSLILTDDDFSKMVDAVAMGRKIYYNLKKAIQYIISIHIPIILTVALPLILGWAYPAIFTPVHVIFLELIMGPTCSIVYENEPLEKDSMLHPPRPISQTFLKWKELSVSIVQGMAITAGTLLMYQFGIISGMDEPTTRTLVFATLVFANIILTLVNRSFFYSAWESLKNKNNLMTGVILITIALLMALIYVPVFAGFFHLTALSLPSLLFCAATGFLSVVWFEGYKWQRRRMAVAKPQQQTRI
jgi:P-type Ca2+ transporter type 2C